MSNNLVTSVYRFVIDDVITNVRRDFEDMGVDETILHELQRSWETKIAQTRVTNFQAQEAAAPAETYAYEEQSYEAPATTSASAPAPGSTSAAAEHTAAANLASMASSGTSANHDKQFAHPAKATSSGSGQGNTGGNSTTNGASGNSIPQTDGAADISSPAPALSKMSTEELDDLLEQKFAAARAVEKEEAHTTSMEGLSFTLTPIDRETRKARFSELQQRIGQVDGDAADEDDTGLGSDLDDSDGDVDEETDNIVLCQYDKVSRTKSKWKCVLKDGIMLINGRDFLFHKANGDLEW
ncbi:transcription factor IIA subunit alpha [Actinomortierella ambigua]|uniref:Transcription initiation factor IIA large subunit n=1 Tax=Actinomortierella ambigua TaxID=1343610 RepID=A0A9P6Q1I7_9FUNG|nr:transcription factor IIA subunit alpha [Actinomortierella ambigua]KAG0256582.1 transcription factor IIA subunit alpha [Actinomortierella ambigua]